MKRDFDWEKIYEEIPLEKMGWFHPVLDPDLKQELERLQIHSGTFLDLGTGAGTQAIELSKMGFDVIATDISHSAIKKSINIKEEIEFIQDDILNTKLKEKHFDYIFDRGCFHCLKENDRLKYVQTIQRLLNNNGTLFLKCFNQNNPEIKGGPFQFSKEMIRSYFEDFFKIEQIYDTEYQGTLSKNPKAFFFTISKINEK